MLRLKSLGQTLIEADDARLTPAAETVFATALYLIIEAGHPVGRDELTRLLWPGVSEARAQHGLRQALYRLKTLGAAIKADRSTLNLSPRFCTTDFAPLINPQSTSVLEALAETVSGGFLPGYRPQLSEEFAGWVDRQRDVVHSAVARTLVAGIQAKKRVSDWNGAEQLASLCLTIDPLNEEATLTVAEAAALGGSKAKALSILNHYLKDIGEGAGEIKLPAVLLRRRISEAYQNNVFAVRDAPFVGREEEMAELTRALARAQSGCGSAYVIWGEPGIGKTRLLSEFTRVAALQRLNIVRVGCQSHDVRRPLSAFVDLVPKLLALPGALGCSPESMRYLRRLIAHDPEEARDRESIEQSDISYESARIAIVDVLDAVSAETPCLLELEDAHWLDPQSIRMAHDIANWVISRCVLFLFTSRTTSIADERISPIGLRPLRTDASSEVARAFAREGNGAGEHYRSWCVSSSGGNPYYLIELLRNEAAQGHEYQAPASLARLLHARVMMLSADAKSLLEVCCVLGVHSTIERIATSIDIARPSLLRALAELDTSGMIEVEGSRVLSRHDLLSSVVLAQMSGAVKLMLHRYVAAQLETEADVTHSVSLIWESAEHWLSASDSARAIQLLRRCG
ncbi:MAG: AAA family ATPase, partial [Gemmatimonadaceae bacterium]|nr:AAA family ATPase [Gemmatimonadaceae bacterium]